MSDLDELETDLEQIRTLQAQEELLGDHLEKNPHDYAVKRLSDGLRNRIESETYLLEYSVDLD